MPFFQTFFSADWIFWWRMFHSDIWMGNSEILLQCREFPNQQWYMNHHWYFDTSLLGLCADCAAVWLGPLRLGRSDRLACLSFSKVLFLCRLSLCLTRNVLLSFLGIQIIVSCTPALLEGQLCSRVFRSGSEPMTPVPAGPANYHKIWADNKPSVIISTLQLLFFCSD